MKKAILLTVVLLSCLFIFNCSSNTSQGESPVYDLVILHTNDFHGHPLKFYNYPAPDIAGLPAIATFVREMREQNPNILVLDAGDINTGRPESNFFNAEPDIIGYNYIGYDVMTLGNHEFDISRDLLKKQMKLAQFPFISANIKTKAGDYLTTPFVIKKFQGFTVGIFGLTTKETETLGSPDNTKDLVFEDEVIAANKMVAELKAKGADIIIALVHMGLYDNNGLGSRRIAAKVKGIDLIIDGHTHSQIEQPVYESGVPIVQAWCWGMYMGEAHVKIKDKKVINFTWKPEPVNLKTKVKKDDGTSELTFISKEYPEDQTLLGMLQPYADKVDAVLSEVIGKAEENFFNGKSRSMETELGDMVADSMVWFTRNQNVDFAIQNGGGIRADLPKGEIQKKVIYEILPFDNSIMVLKLTGSQVIKLFDYVAMIPNGNGAFSQVSKGVSFTINYETKKCENLLINGNPVDEKKMYSVATNSYMAAGGDGYSVFKEAPDRYDTSVFQRDAFIDYIIFLGGTIKPVLDNRIGIIGLPLTSRFFIKPEEPGTFMFLTSKEAA